MFVAPVTGIRNVSIHARASLKRFMKTVILCGGQGTRLREETEFRPKPLVEIGGRPILWHIMKTYAQHSLRDFVLCLGYRGNMIKEYFLNYEAMNNDFTIDLGRRNQIWYHGMHQEQEFCVTLVDTGQETMTGGRIKRIQKYIDADTFAVTYGDGVTDLNIRDVIDFHHRHGKVATVTTVSPISRFGMLDIQESGQVSSFSEKPQLDGWMSAGYFVFNRRIFDYLTEDCVLENGPLDALASEGELMAYRHNGFFFAMDTYREYNFLNELWRSNQAPWKVWA
jgi:glucose-1-phosphate cytidylyltransferase